MIRLMTFALTALVLVFVQPAFAGESGPRVRVIKAAFEDVFLDLQDTIIARGLVIDYTGHIDKMLMRTAEAAESITESGEKTPYLNAKYLQFCSAKLTHEAVSANPQNLSICPYIIYLYETRTTPGTVYLGYRKPAFGPSKASRAIKVKINDFLQSIVDETADGAE